MDGRVSSSAVGNGGAVPNCCQTNSHQCRKGRNRDTAWYAMLDGERLDRKAAFERRLSPENFDGEGRQIRKLVGQG
jgi:hypothetical protein